jgi:uncharacterized protein (DUF697 family)
VIVVITKSYSQTERDENIKTVQNAFAMQKKYSKNLKEIIPVVAEQYRINDTVIVPPDGIDELIDATNRLMPEGKMAAEKDVAAFKLRRKRAMANGLIGTFTTAGATVGAFPMPVADAVVLSTLEATEVNALASIYEIKRGEESKEFLSTIIEMGTVSIAARAAISAIKAIPGINIAASVLDAIIAGSFVAAIGQASAFAFEQVYLGERTLDDLDWLRKLFESELSNGFVEKAGSIVKQVSESGAPKNVSGMISELVKVAFAKG